MNCRHVLDEIGRLWAEGRKLKAQSKDGGRFGLHPGGGPRKEVDLHAEPDSEIRTWFCAAAGPCYCSIRLCGILWIDVFSPLAGVALRPDLMAAIVAGAENHSDARSTIAHTSRTARYEKVFSAVRTA